MASYFIRPDSRYYWIRYKTPSGTWGQRSSGIVIADPGAKRKIAQQVADETAKEDFQDSDGSAMLTRWVPAWIEYKYKKNKKSVSRAKNAWAHLSVFFEDRDIKHPGEVTYAVAHDFMRWRTTKKVGKKIAAWNTAITEVRFLGAIMQEALRRGWIIANPCAKLCLQKEDPAPKRVISREEEELIFRELRERGKPKWMEESFLVAIKQGCRMREVEVPLSRIDTEAMTITFWVKGGRFHTAPLHPDLLPLVARAKAEKRETLVSLPAQTSPRWSEFFELIKLEGLCFHCTRVTVVTRLCEAGFSESQTMAYVGHASELVHALYRKMRPSAVAGLCNAL